MPSRAPTSAESHATRNLEEKMKKKLSTVVATTLSVLLASSSAFAFCLGEKEFVVDGLFGLGKDTVQCREGDLFATMEVTRFDSTSYFYLFGAENLTSEVGGVLLDSTGSVVIGNGGPCNQSVFATGLFVSQAFCTNANAQVQFIRVFAE
jgi:hypothetical protein